MTTHFTKRTALAVAAVFAAGLIGSEAVEADVETLVGVVYTVDLDDGVSSVELDAEGEDGAVETVNVAADDTGKKLGALDGKKVVVTGQRLGSGMKVATFQELKKFEGRLSVKLGEGGKPASASLTVREAGKTRALQIDLNAARGRALAEAHQEDAVEVYALSSKRGDAEWLTVHTYAMGIEAREPDDEEEMDRVRFLVLALCALLAVALVPHTAHAQGKKEKPAASVTYVVVQVGEIFEVVASGELKAHKKKVTDAHKQSVKDYEAAKKQARADKEKFVEKKPKAPLYKVHRKVLKTEEEAQAHADALKAELEKKKAELEKKKKKKPA